MAAAGPLLYVDDAAGRLATVDVSTGFTTVIGNTGVVLFDIAFDPSGKLFGIDGNALYAVDAGTAAATFIGGSGGEINALVFGTDGTLYGASNALFRIDPADGSRVQIGANFAGGVTSSGDLAFVGGNLYLSTFDVVDRLVRLDTVTGAVTDIGSTGFIDVFGLASPNGVDLYGFAGLQVLSIDVATGAGTVLASVNGATLDVVFGSAFRTEAVTPIPEPSTYAMLGGGLLLVAGAARRRKTR